MPWHQASNVRTHPSVASFAFFLCSTKFAYCKRRLNTVETWQRGYESGSFVARYSFLHYRADLDEARSDDALHPGSLLRFWGGPLHRDSWTIQAPSPCNGPPSIFGAWALAQDNMVIAVCQESNKISTVNVIPRFWTQDLLNFYSTLTAIWFLLYL